MRRLALTLVILVFLFGLIVSSAIAEGPDKRIEKSITKLKQVQDLLEEEDQEEGASILAEVKSEISQARFQLLTTESERTFVGNQWAIEFSEELNVKTELRSYSDSDKYMIEVGEATVENLGEEKRGAGIDSYLLDPEGIQRSLGLSPTFYVLPGATKYFSWRASIEKSKFVPGTYTMLFKPRFDSEPESLRFTIDLNEEDFSE